MGKVISPNDKEFADVFSRFVNGKMGMLSLLEKSWLMTIVT